MLIRVKHLVVLILFTNCNSPNQAEKESIITNIEETLKISPIFEEQNGTSYSDSIVSMLVASQLPQPPIKLDTFRLLHNIQCKSDFIIEEYWVKIESIPSYKHGKLNAGLLNLLGVSTCLFKYYSNSQIDAYIFYSEIVESHYSESVQLVVIEKETCIHHSLTLAIEYGNELGDYAIQSKVRKDLKIERVINNNIRNIHGIGKVDSMYLEREVYSLSKDGKIVRVSYTIEPSNKRNKIFENM